MGELKVRWTTQAADDLEAVFEFIAKDKPSAAPRIARKVRDCSRLLARYPQFGRVGNPAIIVTRWTSRKFGG